MAAQENTPILPSGFSILQGLSEAVVRNWGPVATAVDSSKPTDPWYAPYDTAAHSLRRLQCEINRILDNTERAILAARNAASPVSKLPNEILRLVFMSLGGDMEGRIAVSHTCSLWREIITKDPFNWTTIDLATISTDRIASRVFRLAQDLPLRVSCNNWTDLRLNCAVFEISRIEELDVVYTVPMFMSLCRKNAPLLKKFKISVPFINSLTYLPYIFARRHPMLKELTMFNCRLMFNIDNYRGLTKLDIRFCLPTVLLRQNDYFANIFLGSPDLEELRLENLSLHCEEYEGTGIITLKRLRTMHLRLSSKDVNGLLSCISAPSSLQLTIFAYGTNKRRTLGAMTAPKQPCLQVLSESRYLFVDSTWSLVSAFRDVDGTQPLFYHKVLDIEYSPQDPFVSDMLALIVGLHSMPHLTSVCLRDVEASAILLLLQRCPTISILTLVYSDEGIGNTIIIPQLMHQLRLADDLICQNLHTLRLERVHIDIGTMGDLVEMRDRCPEFRKLHLHYCQGDLPSEDIVEILAEEFDVAAWSPHSLIKHAELSPCAVHYPDD